MWFLPYLFQDGRPRLEIYNVTMCNVLLVSLVIISATVTEVLVSPEEVESRIYECRVAGSLEVTWRGQQGESSPFPLIDGSNGAEISGFTENSETVSVLRLHGIFESITCGVSGIQMTSVFQQLDPIFGMV